MFLKYDNHLKYKLENDLLGKGYSVNYNKEILR
jgi:hypothetical protein